MHGPAAAFNVYKVALPHYSTIFLFNLFLNPSLARPLSVSYPESSVGLAAGENLDDTAGLKPEPWISYSRVDTQVSATAIIPLQAVGLVEIRA
jgi:hypothetical protein